MMEILENFIKNTDSSQEMSYHISRTFHMRSKVSSVDKLGA